VTVALVSGPLANKPGNGGAAWTRLTWILGLRRLGLDVRFVEQIDGAACVDGSGAPSPIESSVNLSFFRSVTEAFGLAGSANLVSESGELIYGQGLSELEDLAAEADLLVNLSGHLAIEPLRSLPRRKVYVDLDPGFTQLWHSSGNSGPRLEGHDFFFTVGQNIGTPGCPIPTNGIRWRPIGRPVVLEAWPVATQGAAERLTTVGSWRGPYGPVEHEGQTLGLKVHEWRKFLDLPRLAPQTFEVALELHPDEDRDLEALRTHGWHVVDPAEVAGDPVSFRNYVQGSGGEFSVAQGVYVETRSGWFSDRTASYLASGKPVLVQDTGFSRVHPVGEGLLTFRTLEDAVAGARSIAEDYEGHARAARRFAEEHLDSDRVLGRLLEQVGVSP
jgi:hypothetical protein